MRRQCSAVVLGVALVLAACSNSGKDSAKSSTTKSGGDGGVSVDQPGVTDTEIRVGGVASVNNPLGGDYGAAFDGVKAYFDMVNAEGGVHGRKLVLASERDDQLARNQAEVQALVSQDDVFAALPIAVLLFTGAQTLTDNGVPAFGWNINPEWTGRDNLFGHLSAICFGCEEHFVPWLATEKVGAKKVGILSYGVSEQSKQCAEGLKKSFERFGDADVAYYDDTLSFGVTDLSTQVAAMKDAGVDFVTTCMDQNGALTLAKEMKKQGLDAPQYMPNAYDAEFIAANAEFFDGSYAAPQFVPFEQEPEPPGMKKYKKWIGKAGKEPSELSLIGWVSADQFVTGLEAAGEDFSREKVIAALNEMSDYNADGVLEPIDWTKQHEDPAENPDTLGPQDCQTFLEIKDGKFQMPKELSDAGKPFICFERKSDDFVISYGD